MTLNPLMPFYLTVKTGPFLVLRCLATLISYYFVSRDSFFYANIIGLDHMLHSVTPYLDLQSGEKALGEGN